jgi:hypoxanthine phosphoribosyltransferase
MKVLITPEQIQDRVVELGRDIRAQFQDPITVIGVLTGSLVFLADLIRQIDRPLQIGLIQASSYRGPATTAGTLVIKEEMLPALKDRHVLLLDDILDSGQTISRIVEYIKTLEPASVKTCVLLRKIGRQTIPFEPDFVGFTIPDQFVVGYGLDFNDDYRHLPYIGVLPADRIAAK